MSDLFDPLRDLTREPVSSTPASEVRRRGDQQRRRRTAVQVLGGAAAIAAIALGAGALANGSPTTSHEVPPASQDVSPTPSPAPSESTGTDTQVGDAWIVRMPQGFPLDAGMLDLDEVEGPSRTVSWLTEATLCGDVASYSPADVQTDSVGVNHTALESGGTQRRVLMVYPDAATARSMAHDLIGKFEACPRYPTDTGDSGAGEATNEVTSRDAGDEAWTVKTGNLFDGEPNIGQAVYVVVRVGNAVVYQMLSTEGPGLTRPGYFEKTALAELGAMSDTVAAMCVFRQGGCGESTDTTSAPTFGPDGYGDVRLYLTPEEVVDTGQATVNDDGNGPDACDSLTYTGHEAGLVDGYANTFGVVVLFAPEGVTTPEGLGLGSTEDELTRLYPDAEKITSGYLIPLDGAKRYATVMDAGEVVTLSLESDDQTCIR